MADLLPAKEPTTRPSLHCRSWCVCRWLRRTAHRAGTLGEDDASVMQMVCNALMTTPPRRHMFTLAVAQTLFAPAFQPPLVHCTGRPGVADCGAGWPSLPDVTPDQSPDDQTPHCVAALRCVEGGAWLWSRPCRSEW